jgi:putative two-component system response regulator
MPCGPDALINPKKPKFTHEKSCAIIMEGIGRHFDPAVIAAFRAAECEFAEIRKRMETITI